MTAGAKVYADRGMQPQKSSGDELGDHVSMAESAADGYLMMTNVPPEEWLAKVLTYPQFIGRSLDCEIVIPEKYAQVSRRHAQIEKKQNGFSIQDVGSTGGTMLNGVQLRRNRPTQLVIGDRISLAGLELYLVSATAEVLQHPQDHALDEEVISESTSILRSQASTLPNGDQDLIPHKDRIRSLSPAELEVVRWICRGLMTDAEIGRQLYRSPHTVRTQLCSVFHKLDVHSREQLIGLLRQHEIAWTKSVEPSNEKRGHLTDVNIPCADDDA